MFFDQIGKLRNILTLFNIEAIIGIIQHNSNYYFIKYRCTLIGYMTIIIHSLAKLRGLKRNIEYGLKIAKEY